MGGSPPPAPTTTTTQTEFPKELQPYISDILGRGKAVYEQRAEAGYQPYTDPRIAEFDPAQQAAFAGIQGMVGGAEPYFGAAGQQLGLAGQGIGAGQQLTGAAAQTAGAGLGYLDPAAQAIGAGADITAAGLGGIQAGQQQLGRAADVTAGGLANLLGASAIGQQAGMGVSGAEALGRRGELGLMAGEQMLDPAARLAAASAGDIRGDIGSYMSPYMRQVMDVQKREAIRQSEIAGQADAARAAAAGAFGGSRQAILEAERERNLQQQLGDIEATGMQAAYADAARLAEAQRARELAASGQFGQIAGQAGQLGLGRGQLAGTLGGLAGQRAGLAGLQADIARTRGTLGGQLAGIGGQQVGAGQAYGQLGTQLGGLGTQLAGLTSQTTDVARTLGGLGQTAGQLAGQRGTLAGQLSALGTGRQAQTAQELAALESVGRTRQQQMQQALDIPYQQFLEEKAFPMRALQDYSSLIRGYYVNPNVTRTQMIPQPSYLQQALGAGATAAGIYGGFGGFNRKEGGKVDPRGGLGSIVVKRQTGGGVEQYQENIRNVRNMVSAGDISKEEGDRIISVLEKEQEKEKEVKKQAQQRADAEKKPGKMRSVEQSRKEFVESLPFPLPDIFNPNYPEGSVVYEGGVTPKVDLKGLRNLLPERVKRDIGAEKLSMSVPFDTKSRIGDRTIPESIKRDIGAEQRAMSVPFDTKSRIGDRINPLTTIMSKLRQYGSDIQDKSAVEAEERRMMAGMGNVDSIPQIARQQARESLTEKQPSVIKASADADTAKSSKPAVVEQSKPVDSESRLNVIEARELDDKVAGEDAIFNQATALKESVSAIDAEFTPTTSSAFKNKFADKIISDLEKYKDKRTGALKDRIKGLDSDRWMVLANFGMNLMAQPGGQSLIQALGKAGKDADVVGSLSKLNDKQLEYADKLDKLDVETTAKLYDISKDQASQIRQDALLDIKRDELLIKARNAKTSALKALFTGQAKKLEDARKAAESFQKRSGATAPRLSKEETSAANTFVSDNEDRIIQSLGKKAPEGTFGPINLGKKLPKDFKIKFRENFRRIRATGESDPYEKALQTTIKQY